MPEEVVEGGSQETETPAVEPKGTGAPEGGKQFDEAYVKGLREEAAKHRTEKNEFRSELEALRTQVKEYQDSQLSAEEKQTRDFDEYRSKAESSTRRAQEAELKYQLALAAQSEKITDVKAAVKLADRELIEFDDSGNITNLPSVIENLRTEYSALFAAATAPNAPSPGATNPARTPKAHKVTREELASLSPDKINELLSSGQLSHLL